MKDDPLARRRAEMRETTPRFARSITIDHPAISTAAHEHLFAFLKEALDGWGYDYRMTDEALPEIPADRACYCTPDASFECVRGGRGCQAHATLSTPVPEAIS